MKFPEKKTKKEIKKYFLRNNLKIIINNCFIEKKSKDLRRSKKTYSPDLNDLYRLHRFIILNKRINVLEYGCGWSTLVIIHALKINEKNYLNKTAGLRFKKKFSLTAVDNEKNFLRITKKRIDNYFRKQKINISYFFSQNSMVYYNGRICTSFDSHPVVNPDFIYLDGPDQFNIKKKLNGMTISDYEMMPMSSDILKYENFLTPGTIILSDGRTANTRFLKNNFQRNWIYKEDKKNDQNLFFLNEPFLGKFNKDQLKFYI